MDSSEDRFPHFADLVAVFEKLRDDGDYENLIQLLLDMRAYKSEFDLLVRDVEQAAAKAMPKKFAENERWMAERRVSHNRRWTETKDLARMVVKHREDEISHPQDVVDVLLDVAAISYFRVGKLREYGLDPEDWSESVESTTVSVVKKGEPVDPA